MAWDIASWLILTRTGQMVGAFVCAAVNGYLMALIYLKKLGFTDTLVALEATMCVLLFFTALAAIVLHTGPRMSKTPWLVASIVTDVALCGLDVGIITIIARAGVPSNCGGLTKDSPLDYSKPPPAPYTTYGFSNQSDGKKGKLDNLCALERGYYFIAVAIMFSYILTIVLTVLRIAEGVYARRFKPEHRLLYRGGGTAAERALFFGNSSYELDEDKPDDPRLQTPRSATSSTAMPSVSGALPPPSEGVMSARPSLRVAPHHQQQHGGLHIQHQQGLPPLQFAPSPPATSPATMHAVPPPHFLPSPTSPVLHQHQSHPPPIPPRIPTPPGGAAPPLSPSSSKPVVLVPGLASDESQSDAAAAAMITDGARFHHHNHHHAHGIAGGSSSGSSSLYGQQLPPAYTPSTPMAGHSPDDSNEMRLSEYVKGQTRAQAMKDSSGRGPGL